MPLESDNDTETVMYSFLRLSTPLRLQEPTLRMPSHSFSLIPGKIVKSAARDTERYEGSRLLQVIDFILRQLTIHNAFVDAAD